MILTNGAPAGQVSALDRGLAYGDGLFETLAVRAGVARHWDDHLTRLAHGCARLGIAMPDTALLRTEAESWCRGTARGVLKLIVTRGVGGRGYRADPSAPPTRVFSLHPWPEDIEAHAKQGVRVRLCTLRLAHQPALAGLKHLNRLEQVLARSEWDDPGIAEGLLMDEQGRLIEATSSNLFLVADGALFTPDLTRCGVAGVTRARILRHAGALGIAVHVTNVTQDMMARASEVFLCNSVIGLWPVTVCESLRYAIGPLTRRLQAACEEDEP
jgi:4-amino-4-deoxychorismate lyase